MNFSSIMCKTRDPIKYETPHGLFGKSTSKTFMPGDNI